MKPKKLIHFGFLSLVLVALLSLLAGCGGGGGGGSAPGASQTGTVAIFIKDAPTDEFEKILVTVTEVSLIPLSGAPVVIYSNPSGCEIDLLQYREEDFLLTIKRDVPAGTYSKVRLQVTNIDLIPKEGKPLVTEVKLPSGKIDLNPRGTFTVVPGGSLSVRIDMDANKAIHVHPSRPGWYIFRPVVFVDIEAGFPESICPKIVHGTIDELIRDGGQTTGFIMTLADHRGKLTVKLNADTEIFLSYGEFGDASELTEGEEVWVRGKMDSSGALAASLVIEGDVVDLQGEVARAVVSNAFWLTMFRGEAFIGTYEVAIVLGKTLILTDCNTEVGPEAIQEGMVARVFVKLVGFQIQAVVVILRPKEVSGEITAASDVSGGRQITVLPEGETTAVQVLVPAAAPVCIEGDGQVPASYLTVGRNVRILVDPAIASPVTAKKVFIVGTKVEGIVTAVNISTRMMTAGGYSAYVPTNATILDLRNSRNVSATFADMTVGTKVVFFVLTAASPGTYEAPVVLIVD